MKKIRINLKKRSYNIFIGNKIMQNIGNLIDPAFFKNPILIVTNRKINSLYGKTILKILKPLAKNIFIKEVPGSEKAKSFSAYNRIISVLTKIGKKAKPVIIALGGGVVGDVSGFAASTYRRGIPYIQVPTTLLASVDSSIGGKVAIDLPQAKNIVGSFYQPKAVIIDTTFLKTLPKKEVRNGLAEIIKYGVIADRGFFEYLEKNIKKSLTFTKKDVEHIIFRCAGIKATVVSKDEFDVKDKRAILNYGHTFAHAIETSFKYSKNYTHGEAVAIGMALAAKLAFKINMITKPECGRIQALIKQAGLPVKIRKGNIAKILKAIDYDKKFLAGKRRFVLPEKIGAVKVVEGISKELIRSVLIQ